MEIQTIIETGHPADNEIRQLSIPEIDKALSVLSTAISCHIISVADARKQRSLLMSIKKQKILDTYPLKKWKASNGTYKAYVPDSTKPKNRRLIQGKDEDSLEKNILEDYKKRVDDRLVFSKYFANWLVNYKSNLVQPATIQRNYDDYRKFIAGTRLDSMRITDIKRKDIKNLLDSIVNEHGLTRKSLNNVKSLFNGMFAHALDVEDILSNPTLGITIKNSNLRPETVKDASTEIFNRQELDALVEYLYNHYMDNRPIVTLAILLNLQLGLRVGELCTLKKTDIDMERHTIRIERTERSYRPISLENGKIVEEKTVHDVTDGRTKKDSNRILDLSDEALAIIHRALKLQKELSIKSDYLFADSKGEHIIRQRVNDCLRFYCKKISLDVKSSHKIRKTVLSNLFANGFDFEEVMEIAGHRNKSTTLKYYLFSVKVNSDRKSRLNQALASNHCTFQSTPGQP